MLDERAVSVFGELRGRGFDVRILEIDPEEFVTPAESESSEMARRIWTLDREATRSRFARHGIPLVRWEPGTPLQAAILAIEGAARRA